ncbi:hypothetical protein F750_2189 [Streptomyces sp. PAMC 26508]|nr:hypothetical protein F750_2189 [Streptomyces sp. PAMC 26508]
MVAAYMVRSGGGGGRPEARNVRKRSAAHSGGRRMSPCHMGGQAPGS